MTGVNEERTLLAELKFQLVSVLWELKFRRLVRALKANFNPAQPRDEHGRWTDENRRQIARGEGINDSRIISDATPDGWILGAEYAAADGHHFVPRGVFGKEKYGFTSEVLEIFKKETTGQLKDPTSNRYDTMHREYNDAVEEALDRFMKNNNIGRGQMTPDEARSFASEIRRSDEPRIRQFNRRVYMREIMRSLRYFHGRE